MSSDRPDTPASRNEISLRELIQRVQSYARELLRHWKILLLFTLPFVGYYIYVAVSAPDKYRATLTFMVNDDSSKMSGYSSVLANLGMGIGPSTEYNLDKILELSRSNLIVRRALFRRDTLNGEADFLANHMIRAFDYHAKWEGKWLDGMLFTHDSFPALTRREKAALKALNRGIVGSPQEEGSVRSHYSESSGIMTMETTTPSEKLSLSLSGVLFDELSQYYIETAIEKSKDTYDRLKEKADSVRTVLESKQYQLANFEDSNRGLITRRAAVERQRLQGEVQMLATLYGETVQNMEVSSFALKNDTPFIRAIDEPYAPLWNLKPRWYLLIPRGIILGLVLGSAFVLGRRLLRDIMQSASPHSTKTT